MLIPGHEFLDPLTDWRHPSHDIYASQSMAELPQEPPQAKTCHDTALKDRLDSIQGEMRHAVNKINEHIDASKKRKPSAY